MHTHTHTHNSRIYMHTHNLFHAVGPTCVIKTVYSQSFLSQYTYTYIIHTHLYIIHTHLYIIYTHLYIMLTIHTTHHVYTRLFHAIGPTCVIKAEYSHSFLPQYTYIFIYYTHIYIHLYIYIHTHIPTHAYIHAYFSCHRSYMRHQSRVFTVISIALKIPQKEPAT
jgi:hypothetical protein